MSSSAKVVLYSAVILVSSVLVSEVLIRNGVPVSESRTAVAIVAAAMQFLVIHRWWKAEVRDEVLLCEEEPRDRRGELHVQASELRGDVALAADHIESIRALLEVSTTHQQPIPRAALRNLELVSKQLRKIERRLDAPAEAAGGVRRL